MQGAAQGVDVGGGADPVALAPELLGGHVGRRAQDPVGVGEGRLVQGHGQAEVAHEGDPPALGVALQQDVGGLEVPVDQVQAVGQRGPPRPPGPGW